MNEALDIPCSETHCSHLDAERGRCRLTGPVAADSCGWIFALRQCRIAAAAGELIGRATGRGPDADASARLKAWDLQVIDDRNDGPRMIDQVVEALREGSNDDEARVDWESVPARAALATARRLIQADTRRAGRGWRRLASTPAAAAAWMLALTLLTVGVWGAFVRDSKPADLPSTLFEARPDRELDERALEEGFGIELRSQASLYVSVHFLTTTGQLHRLFPPLARPRPLPASADPVRLPGEDGLFRISGPHSGNILVVADPEASPDVEKVVAQSDLPLQAVRARWPDARIIPIERDHP